MDELTKQPETPAEETQVKEVTASEVAAEPKQTDQQPEGAEIKSSQEQTRLEKRISDLEGKLEEAKTEKDREKIQALISRLKEKLKPKTFSSEMFQKEPLIRPDDLEYGIDPVELERRAALRELALKDQIKAELAQEEQYKGMVKEHIADQEKVMNEVEELNPKSEKYDKDFDRLVSQQYQLANYVYNPFTGQYDFVPTIKMSEIVSNIKKVLEKKTTKAVADTSLRLSQQAGEASIPPSSTEIETEDTEEIALFKKAQQTRDDEDWAAYLKRRLKLGE